MPTATASSTRTEQAHWVLAQFAAETPHAIRYGQFGVALELAFPGVPVPRWHQGPLLTEVAALCKANGEPDLSSMVVSARSGEPLSGYTGPDPEPERWACHRHFRAAKYGK